MLIFWAAIIILLVLAGFGLGLRGVRGSAGGTEAASDKALRVFKGQLDEISVDEAQGRINTIEAQSARVEIKRRMLAATRRAPSKTQTGAVWPLIAAILAVPVLALGLYMQLGAPAVPSQPFAARPAAPDVPNSAAEAYALAERLYDRLNAMPEGAQPQGWVLLGRTFLGLEEYDRALDALLRVSGPEAEAIAYQVSLAEAQIGANGGRVDRAARDLLDQILEAAPDEPAAIFYKSLWFEQNEAPQQAYEILIARLDQANGAENWIPLYHDRINSLAAAFGFASLAGPTERAPGPTQADIDAAQDMTLEEQDAFIRSMVDGLAQKLQDDPSDIDGWLRLTQAYFVLEEVDKAGNALEQAEALATALPQDDPRRAVITRFRAQLN